jgi:L-ascorbate metabolism protein UlaG (beta-lactamase superfamily)
MKKWLKRITGIFVVLLLVLFGAGFWTELDETVLTSYTDKYGLQTVKPGWKGTPVDQKGRFMNDESPTLMKTSRFLRWQFRSNPFEKEKALDTYIPRVQAPEEFLSSNLDGLIWLGHATFLIRLDGVTILTDPVFGEPPFVKRYVPVLSPLEKIERLDYVLLSHDHRDHMDEPTLRRVAERFPDARFLSGLASDDVLSDLVSRTNEVMTAGWFQRFDLREANLDVFFLPVRHWSRRGLFDTNARLWGGFVIRSGETSIYFGGDSGYGRHYRETGELFPDIDYFLIGIGAYEPRWFMEPNHNNPADALKAFQDSGARTLVPMHYGTFDLSDEPPGSPLRELTAEAERAKISEHIKILDINGHIAFD